MKMNCFLIYQLMYLTLDELYNERPNDDLATYLSEANPYLYNDESSADPSVYSEFSEKYAEEIIDYEAFGYSFILKYLKGLTYYKHIYETFAALDKEDYILTCENTLKNYMDILKL